MRLVGLLLTHHHVLNLLDAARVLAENGPHLLVLVEYLGVPEVLGQLLSALVPCVVQLADLR